MFKLEIVQREGVPCVCTEQFFSGVPVNGLYHTKPRDGVMQFRLVVLAGFLLVGPDGPIIFAFGVKLNFRRLLHFKPIYIVHCLEQMRSIRLQPYRRNYLDVPHFNIKNNVLRNIMKNIQDLNNIMYQKCNLPPEIHSCH